MEMSKLSKNIFYNLTGQSLLLILGFVAVKVVFKQLGEDALGILYFTLTLNVLLTNVLGMGICETTVREVSAHFKTEPGYIRDLLRTASLCYWGAYLLFAIAIYCGAPMLVERWIHLENLDAGTAIKVLRILGISSFVALPRSFYTSILRGVERMEFTNFIDVSASALQQFGTIAILLWGGGLLQVVYWMSACYGLAVVAYWLACAHFFSWSSLRPGFSFSVIPRNFTFTSHMALISLLVMIHTQLDKVMVSKLLPIGLFGMYTVAYGAVSRTTMMTSAVSQAAFPNLSALFKSGERASLMAQYHKLQDLICFATVPLFAAVLFAARPLFTYLFNPDGAKTLQLPFAFLCVGFYMNGTLTTPYVFSLAAGRPDIAARTNLYALFVVLPVTGALIYFFGLNGAGLSWVFYHLFAYAYQVPRICSECLGIPTWKWYRQILRILMSTGLTYGTAWAVLDLERADSGVFLILAYAAASAGFLAAGYVMIGDELRSSFEGLVRNCRAKYAEEF
jgi:O-antigen/teichoic acid export membrane protein